MQNFIQIPLKTGVQNVFKLVKVNLPIKEFELRP